MELKLVEVLYSEPKQMIVIQVEEDCNLWPYILMVFDGNSSNRGIPSFTYVFEAKLVKKNDYILVHSIDGKDSVTKNRLGTNSHSFYMGDNMLFPEKTGKYNVVLMKVDEYQRFK